MKVKFHELMRTSFNFREVIELRTNIKISVEFHEVITIRTKIFSRGIIMTTMKPFIQYQMDIKVRTYCSSHEVITMITRRFSHRVIMTTVISII